MKREDDREKEFQVILDMMKQHNVPDASIKTFCALYDNLYLSQRALKARFGSKNIDVTPELVFAFYDRWMDLEAQREPELEEKSEEESEKEEEEEEEEEEETKKNETTKTRPN